ncbi:MAG: DUF885 domain-containing protein [Theionarchaea archaeon]|nr:DUF885 domain-containing protein [Theionarchaea archaeon]MBU7036669.1 DUF885 domain-containing protein [Theionarchaea archaeon]
MDDEFDSAVRDAFYSLMEFRPDLATGFGLHQYDKKMPSGTRESHSVFIEGVSEHLERMQVIDRKDLSREKQIDYDLMISITREYLFQEQEIRMWERDPDCASIIGYAIVPLFSREFAPFETRLESITARLQQCPLFIREIKSRISAPAALWRDMAVESCTVLPLFFQVISSTAKQKGVETDDLDEASARTAEALSSYVEWLSELLCEGEPTLGRPLFERLLEVRELGMAADEILHLGEEYLLKEKEHLKILASRIDPQLSVEQVRTQIRDDHPSTFQDAFRQYGEAIEKVRDLVTSEQIASLPRGERLVVEETPVFLRHIVPTAAYFPPAPFEDDQMGIYFVTPVDDHLLTEHDKSSIVNTSVHEAYPGHHLQAVWASRNSSLVRQLSTAPEFIEGWAHYCEEIMRYHGLGDPRIQFVQTVDIIFRAVRIVIDVSLHCRTMTFDQALTFLRRETGMSLSTAKAEVKRYTQTPGYPLSYLLGKHMLLELREDVKNHLGKAYSEQAFHDVLLRAGSLPFKYLRQELAMKGML